MPFLRYLSVLLLFAAFSLQVSGQGKQKEVNFPTNDEIQLLVTQAGRAVAQYESLLDQEQSMLGGQGSDAVAKDREVVAGLKLGIQGFGKNPQAFNGPLGFSFFEWLDDASRNAVLCAANASNDAFKNLLNGEKDKAISDLHLSQSCTDVSSLLYTVSENAGALYTRYVEGIQNTAEEGLRVSQKCADILKQKSSVPKP